MWVAAATYCAVLAPASLLATLIGVVGMAHYSIGRGSGSFIGGQIISKYGIRDAFQIMGVFAGCSGVIYTVLYRCWLKKHDSGVDKDSGKLFSCVVQNKPKTITTIIRGRFKKIKNR